MQVLSAHDEEQYDALLQRAVTDRQNVFISNRRPWQTWLGVTRLLEYAKEKGLPVDILSGTGGPCAYSDEGKITPRLKDIAKTLAREGDAKVRMLVYNESPNMIAKELRQLSRDRHIPFILKCSRTAEMEGDIPHFMLVGDHAYRLEAGHKPLDPDEKITRDEPVLKAVFNFNDPMYGQRLKSLFDSLFQNAEVVA